MNRKYMRLMLALGGAISLTAIPAAIIIRQSELNAIERDFRIDVDNLTTVANQELKLNFSSLEGLSLLFTGSETVTSEEFRRVAQRYLSKRPEIQALKWVPYVPQAQRQLFETQFQQESPPFKITQWLPQGQVIPAQDQSAYFPVAFVAPYGGNESVLGLDLGSHPQLRQTLEQARDAGQDLVAARVSWVQDPFAQDSFLVLSPVYRGQPQTAQERQAQLQGFVIGVYRVEDVLAPVIAKAKTLDIVLKILDQTDPRQPQTLVDLPNPAPLTTTHLRHETLLPVVQGRSWGLTAQATSQYIHQNSSRLFLLWPLLGAAFLLSSVIFLVMRRQQSAALEQETYFQSMANQSPTLMWMTETDQSFSFFNSAWLIFTGKTLQAEKGTQWMVGIHAEDRQNWQRAYNASFNRRDPFTIEHRLLQADGTYAWMVSIGQPRYNTKGEFAGYIGTSIDISRFKQADIQCQLINQELLRSNQDLEQMAAVLSHDMREPLRKIQAFTELIQADYLDDLDEKGQRYFSYVIDAAQRMQAMIDAVLAYARLESGEREVVLTDLNQVVEQVQQDLSLAIQKQDAVIEVDRLPKIMINTVDIRRVFQNLLANALKFRSEAVPVIQVSSRQQQEAWLIMVRDNGIGIAPEHLGRIFVMLKRLHDRTSYEGNGIGLAICKKILERYGGSIWAESEVGEGTTFYIQLPIHPQDYMATDDPFLRVFDF